MHNFMKKIIFLFLLVFITTPLHAKEFYRYKNSEGKIIVKDQISNEMIETGYEILNDNGALVQKVSPGKTLAQEEQERLKQIEEKKSHYQLQQRIRNDAELLRQFSSIGDIIRNRDAQLLGLEQRIRIQNSKSDLLKLQLEDQQKSAANHERLGQKLPKKLQKEIKESHEQIAGNERNTVFLEQQKVTIAKRFEGDIIRYKKLESLRMNLKQTKELNDGTKAIIYDCPSQKVCLLAWQLAQIYAKDHASGRIEIITNTLILTSKPEKDTDMALSFSKIPVSDNNSQIVLEVSCNNSEQGAMLCKSEIAKNMRTNYLSYIESKL
jgi:hypothetical protein